MHNDASLLGRLWFAFQEGGWMMWLIFLFGLLAVTAAGRFALRGERQFLSFIHWMSATTLAAGVFGFAIGMSLVFSYVVYKARPDDRWLILVDGMREALQNVNAALLFTVLVYLLVAVGHRRYPLPNPSATLK
jgi:hypothetical protein